MAEQCQKNNNKKIYFLHLLKCIKIRPIFSECEVGNIVEVLGKTGLINVPSPWSLFKSFFFLPVATGEQSGDRPSCSMSCTSTCSVFVKASPGRVWTGSELLRLCCDTELIQFTSHVLELDKEMSTLVQYILQTFNFDFHHSNGCNGEFNCATTLFSYDLGFVFILLDEEIPCWQLKS